MRSPCCDNRGNNNNNNKGAWSKEEDRKLIDYIRAHGRVCWRSLPKAAGLLRCGKSCRLRWINYLRPDVKRGRFEEDEEDLIIKLHALLGNRWSLIAGRLPGRTDNEVKNYWNSHLRKKLASMGIDPDNHRVIHNGRLHRSHSSGNATRSSIDDATNGLQNNSKNGFRDADDLNLDLTISLPSSQRTGSDHLQNTASPTLLLFP